MRKLFVFVFVISISVGCKQCIAQKTNDEWFYKTNYRTSEMKLYGKVLRHIKFLQLKCDTIFSYHSSFSPIFEVWYHKNNICYRHTLQRHHPVQRHKYSNIWSINIDEAAIQRYFCCSLCQCDDMPCFEEQLDGIGIDLYIKGQNARYGSVDVDCLYSADYEPNGFGAYITQIMKDVLQIKLKKT